MSCKNCELDEREKDFLQHLGNGKDIFTLEAENDVIDEIITLKQQCFFCNKTIEATSHEELAQKMFDHQMNHNPKAVEMLK